MEKKTASDLRTYLSTFEAKYPLKMGYLAQLILNEKLTTANVCKRFKDIVQTAEPHKQICEERLTSAVNRIKRNVVGKRVNYSQQWINLSKMYQETFVIPLKSKESDSSAATSTLLIQPDHSSQPVMEPDHSFSSAPLVQPDHSSVIQPDLAQHMSETCMIMELTSNSVNNHIESSCSVFSRPPSPKRLKRDCDNCVTKQRTNLNMLKENKSLRLQIRTLKQLHREERKNVF